MESKKIQTLLTTALCFMPMLAHAEDEAHFELQGLVGLTHLNVEQSHITYNYPGLSISSETDTLREASNNTFQGAVGLMYVFPLQCNSCSSFQWFPDAKVGLRAYDFSHDVQGDEWVDEQEIYNNLTYKYDIDNFRLMADVMLTVFSWEDLSLFALGGAGASWNWVEFKNITNTGIIPEGYPSAVTTIDRHQHTTFSWEVGAGMEYALTERLAVSLEYLYADLGVLKAGNDADYNYGTVEITQSPEFRLRTNSVFLGLELAL